MIPNCHIPTQAPTTSQAQLHRSTILSALGPDHALTILFLITQTRTLQWVAYHESPDHALTVLFLRTQTRTSQWVTHHENALARYSINFGAPKRPRARKI
ncbi:hypothetical protein DVH24_017654 [Malus domestica]|uniref:Uncharacterized protein n=1 Tax=Malus domestica TaxID=3750 RepID=A0A498KJ52_MALDO|nr:hypothetical protein DVH24_017654 [Malus domestica]